MSPQLEEFPLLSRRFPRALPTCPLLLVAFALVLHPLFHSLTGHSEYCWEPNWDCDPDWITVSSEFMVSSLEGIPERIRVLFTIPEIISALTAYEEQNLLPTCANAQNGPRGQYPFCLMSLHLVDL